MKKPKILILTIMICAMTGAALAYSNNPVVQARQEAMGLMRAGLKNLFAMANGSADFDPRLAKRSLDRLAAKTAAIPDLFADEQYANGADALPEIWTNWEDFLAKAEAARLAALAAQAEANADNLAQYLAPIAQSCKACHNIYKRE